MKTSLSGHKNLLLLLRKIELRGIILKNAFLL